MNGSKEKGIQGQCEESNSCWFSLWVGHLNKFFFPVAVIWTKGPSKFQIPGEGWGFWSVELISASHRPSLAKDKYFSVPIGVSVT